jgi:hypothetical protein
MAAEYCPVVDALETSSSMLRLAADLALNLIWSEVSSAFGCCVNHDCQLANWRPGWIAQGCQ